MVSLCDNQNHRNNKKLFHILRIERFKWCWVSNGQGSDLEPSHCQHQSWLIVHLTPITKQWNLNQVILLTFSFGKMHLEMSFEKRNHVIWSSVICHYGRHLLPGQHIRWPWTLPYTRKYLRCCSRMHTFHLCSVFFYDISEYMCIFAWWLINTIMWMVKILKQDRNACVISGMIRLW